ncbi:MAG: metal ABC transporter permease [Clostridiaceae bacterium]|nr:metal ABC transporter permease [Clostridiaceae bacterium]
MNIFQYEFMQKAFLVGMTLSVIIPMIGLVVVLKRLSMIGDALSHSSLSGVAMGLIFGANPIFFAILASVISALLIEAIRRKLPKYQEVSIAVVMSLGVGLAGVLSGFVKSTTDFNSFLFGSIVSIPDFEVKLVLGVSFFVILAFLFLYRELFLVSFDEQQAKMAGVNVYLVNFIFTILTAVTVSVASRTVGALIVSSLMVIPVICAMQVAKSFRQTLLFSIFFAAIFMSAGLLMSFYLPLKPGGTIVLIAVLVLVMLFFIKRKS